MTKSPSRRLASRLGKDLAAAAYLHGAAILFPFILFTTFAADAIWRQALGITAAAGMAVLWLCTWDFVRMRMKRGEEPFCFLWLKIFGGMNPRAISAANAIYVFEIKALLLAAAVPAAVALASRQEAALLLAFILWPFVLVRLLDRRLQREAAAPAFLPEAMQAVRLLEEHESLRHDLPRKLRHFAADFIFWGPVMATLSFVAVCLLPGRVPWPLPPGAEEYFAARPEAKQEDAAGFFALVGLSAPRGTADIEDYGRTIAMRRLSGIDVPEPPASEVLSRMPAGFAPRICPRPKDLWFEGCLPVKKWGPVIAANAELLARYAQLYRYRNFDTPFMYAGMEFPGTLLMRLAQLKAVSLAFMAQAGYPEAALQDLLEETRMLGRLLEAHAPYVPHAIYRTAYNSIFAVLPYILSKSPDLAERYRLEIKSVLPFLEAQTSDFSRVADYEARFLMGVVSNHGGKMLLPVDDGRSGLARRSQEFLLAGRGFHAFLGGRVYGAAQGIRAAFAQDGIAARSRAFSALDKKYAHTGSGIFLRLDDLWRGMYQSLIVNNQVETIVRNTAVFDTMGREASRARMLMALLEAMAKGDYPDNMPAALSAVAKKGYAQIPNGEPFSWKADTREICHGYKDEYKARPLEICLGTGYYAE